jgi:hypothetical protein
MRVIHARRKTACALCPATIQRGQQACLATFGDRQAWVHLACYLKLADLYVPARLRPPG